MDATSMNLQAGAQLDALSRSKTEQAERALKSGAEGDELTKAARDLESVFLKMVFDEMDKTVNSEDGMFPRSPGMDMFQGWFRTEVAKNWAQNGGTGLGDMMAEQLRQRGAVDAPSRSGASVVGQMASTSAGAPVSGRITSGFGPRIHPVTGEQSFHKGVDIAVPVGTAVKTPYAGTVVKAGEGEHLGKYVMIEHPGGYRSVYGHNSSLSVQPGDTVAAGATIAQSGNTGRSTGPHVHFGLFKDGKAIDPMRWMGGAKNTTVGGTSSGAVKLTTGGPNLELAAPQ